MSHSSHPNVIAENHKEKLLRKAAEPSASNIVLFGDKLPPRKFLRIVSRSFDDGIQLVQEFASQTWTLTLVPFDVLEQLLSDRKSTRLNSSHG